MLKIVALYASPADALCYHENNRSSRKIMAHPKRKHSKSRTRKRRSQYYGSLDQPETMACPNCGNTKLLHRACPSCGHYRGRQVIEAEEAF